MKWVTVKIMHINTNNLDAFYWYTGKLYLVFNSDPKPVILEDPDRELYLKLCRQQGVQPVEELYD